MIVCICNSVNDRQIRRAIADGHDTLEELQVELGVATRCGKCVGTTCALIEETRCGAAPMFYSGSRKRVQSQSSALNGEASPVPA